MFNTLVRGQSGSAAGTRGQRTVAGAAGTLRRQNSFRRTASQKKRNVILSKRWGSGEKNKPVPLRKRVVNGAKAAVFDWAVWYKKSQLCMLFTTMATVLSCVFYAIGTYIEHDVLVIVVEVIFASVFLVDYVLSLISAPMVLSYALSVEGMIDLFSIVPVFGGIERWVYSFSFIRYLRLGKTIRIMQSHRLLDRIGMFDEVTVNASLLGLKVSGLILTTTAIIYGTEQVLRSEEAFENGDGSSMEWHDALYFTIVTLSTVGYGDVLPIQAFSRMLMVAVILFALTYVPLEVGNLVDVISSRPRNRKGFSMSLVGNQLHVILAMVALGDAGNEPGFDAKCLRRIIEELCHEDHGMDNESLWVVVMAPCPPSPEVLSVIRSPRFMSKVVYYRGSVMEPTDMAAVCAEYADCIFLYPSTDVMASSSLVEERTTLAAKALQRYLDRTPTDPALMAKVEEQSVMGVPCRTLVTVKELRSKDQLLRFGINHVICHDELKMSMLACATLYPSFLPFAINAMRSSSNEDVFATTAVAEDDWLEDSKTAPDPADLDVFDDDEALGGNNSWRRRAGNAAMSVGRPSFPHWLQDYQSGMEFEVYSLPLNVRSPTSLWGASFERAAAALYESSKGEVLLMAVVRDLRTHPHYMQQQQQEEGQRAEEARVDLGAHSDASGRHHAEQHQHQHQHQHQQPHHGRGDSAATEPTGGWRRGERSRATGRNASRSGGAAAAAAADAEAEAAAEVGVWGAGTRDAKVSEDSDEVGDEDVFGASSFVHVSIFPEDFVFKGRCRVMVLAEDKRQAQVHIAELLQKAKAEVSSDRLANTDGSKRSNMGIAREVNVNKIGRGKGGEKDSAAADTGADAALADCEEKENVFEGSRGGGGGNGESRADPGANEGNGAGRDEHAGAATPAPAATIVEPSRAEAQHPAVAAAAAAVTTAAAAEAAERVASEEPAFTVLAESEGHATPATVSAGLKSVVLNKEDTSAVTASIAAEAEDGVGAEGTAMTEESESESAAETAARTPETAEAKATAAAATAADAPAPTANAANPVSTGHHNLVRPSYWRRSSASMSQLFQTKHSGPSGGGSGYASPEHGHGIDGGLGGGVASGVHTGGGSSVSSVQNSPHGGGVGSSLGVRACGGGHRRVISRTTSSTGAYQTEEERTQLESVREELRNEDGVRWSGALMALKAALAQLKALEDNGEMTEAAIAESPSHFFGQVEQASHQLDDALRAHAAAVPAGLTGHFVVIGAHPHLLYFVLALRRQRPNTAIVVITDNEEMFLMMRERLAECKCEELQLEIFKIYAVFGRMQDRGTFEEARIADAESVVLVSNKQDDSEVLLVSFELEQMLGDLPPGARAPKVLIDLHNDNSIYYCGNTLGKGRESRHPSLLRTQGDSGRLKETPGMTAAGVWEWPLFASGRIWTESIMDMFAVQTYFSTEFQAFFETLLQIRRPVLVGSELLQDASFSSKPPTSAFLRSVSSIVDCDSYGGKRRNTPPANADGNAGAKVEESIFEHVNAAFHPAQRRRTFSGYKRRKSGSNDEDPAVDGGESTNAGEGDDHPQKKHQQHQQRGQFDQLHVSRRFRGKPYGRLARELIKRSAMPLGLYRPAGTKRSILQYTHVNPSVSERIVDGDIVFVLKSKSCHLFGSV